MIAPWSKSHPPPSENLSSVIPFQGEIAFALFEGLVSNLQGEIKNLNSAMEALQTENFALWSDLDHKLLDLKREIALLCSELKGKK